MAGFDLAAYCAREFPEGSSARAPSAWCWSRTASFSFGAERARIVRAHDRAGVDGRGLPGRRRRPGSVALPDEQPARRERADIAQLRQAISEQAGVPMVLKVQRPARNSSASRAIPRSRSLSQQRPGDARPPDLHQAACRCSAGTSPPMPTRYRELLRAQRDEGEGAEDHARPGAARGARPEARPRRRRAQRARGGDRRGTLRPHDRRHPARRGARRLARGRARATCSTSSTGTSSRPSCARPARRRCSRGEVVLVTGAASGIGKACVEAFLQARRRRGRPGPQSRRSQACGRRPDFLGMACDLTDAGADRGAPRRGRKAIRRHRHAGPQRRHLPLLPAAPGHRRRDLAADDDASTSRRTLHLLQVCHPLLKLAPRGGRIVVIGSNNVPAPGPGAGAYSASKAALNQLARVAALEWAKDGIRINSLHPDAVYDTGLWTDGAARRARQGLQPDRRAVQEEEPAQDRGVVEATSPSSPPRCAARCSPRPPRRRCRSTAATSASSDATRSSRSAGRATALELLDQRLLPDQTRLRDLHERGRGRARRSATWWCAARRRSAARRLSGLSFRKEVRRAFDVLAKSRPTAVNLFWALERMKKAKDLEAEAKAIFAEDLAANRAMGKHGAALIPKRARVLTYCNTGALATAATARRSGVIRSSKDKNISVIACETRPYLQGARLTAWECVQEGIPCTLITDNMAGHLMSRGEVDVVDRRRRPHRRQRRHGQQDRHLHGRRAREAPRHPVLRRRAALHLRSEDPPTARTSRSRSARRTR